MIFKIANLFLQLLIGCLEREAKRATATIDGLSKASCAVEIARAKQVREANERAAVLQAAITDERVEESRAARKASTLAANLRTLTAVENDDE